MFKNFEIFFPPAQKSSFLQNFTPNCYCFLIEDQAREFMLSMSPTEIENDETELILSFICQWSLN